MQAMKIVKYKYEGDILPQNGWDAVVARYSAPLAPFGDAPIPIILQSESPGRHFLFPEMKHFP